MPPEAPIEATAEAAYVQAMFDCHATLERIQELLSDMPAPDSGTHINWAHVGTVNEVKRQLEAVVEFASHPAADSSN